jgi:5-methylcytosine-specific restriction endonuclease McrA
MRPTREAIATALARLERKLTPAPRIEPPHNHTPPKWEWASSARRCLWCKRSNVQLLYKVRSRPTFTYEANGPTGSVRVMSAECVDQVDCGAYRERRREVQDRRRGRLFVVANPPYSGPYRPGHCRWCGDPIVLVDPSDYRRRARLTHRGDEHEVGDRNCASDYYLSTTYDARTAVVRRDLLEHGHVFCQVCGLVSVELVEGAASRYGRDARERPGCPWEADHRIPLEDGGAHELDNLQCLCVPCHRKKTARENRDRAARRATLPTHAERPARSPRRRDQRPAPREPTPNPF